VLDRAQLRPGDTLLDVGAGDGLIAFGPWNDSAMRGE
jgi:cyclopropane fatty-acyl-phospholipid synthase-like methyltransferase